MKHSISPFPLQLIAFCFALLAGCAVAPGSPTVDEISRSVSLVDQGTLALRKGDFDKAEASFDVAREISGSAASIDGLGCVALLRGEYDHAERLFIEAYSVDSRYGNVLGNLALLYELKGEPERAAALYKRALVEDSQNFRTRGNFGTFIADSLDRGEGRRELLKAEAIASHPLLRENLRRLEN